MQNSSAELQKLASSVTLNPSRPIRHSIAWALGVNLAACVFCLLASLIIAIHNSSIPSETTPDVIGFTDPETGAVVYPVVDCAGAADSQAVYYIPPGETSAGYQPVTSGFLPPPPYEAVVSSPPVYHPSK